MSDYQFYYSLIGNPEQPLILFLHGFLGNIHEFEPDIQLLSNQFSYLTVDLPGHGQTQVLGSDDCYTISKTANGLIQLLDELKITQCFLVGYSMGGRLALYLTLNFPQRFRQVILESASPGLATDLERLNRVRNDYKIAKKLHKINDVANFLEFLDNWYSQSVFAGIKNHPEYHSMIAQRSQNQPLELEKSLRFMGTGFQPSLWEQLPKNTTPLLLLAGEYDPKFIAINQAMTARNKFIQLRVIPQVGHNIHWENTLVFVECIQDFFS